MAIPSLEQILEKHSAEFYPVVPFDTIADKVVKLDLSIDNKNFDHSVFANPDRFSKWIDRHRSDAGAKYAIGGYGEHRSMYSSSTVFDAGNENEEPRRLHLGLDIWGEAGTEVFAPLDATIHSFAINDAPGDYGGTIILKHNLHGIVFYTLYGHLSHASIKTLKKGKPVQKGKAFATFGIPAENGQWPPHLHFQLIKDIGDADGDYPGVCRYSEKAQWLENCPDPGIMLRSR